MRPLQRMTWKTEMSLKQQCHLLIPHPSLIVEITMLTITCECSSPPMPRVSKSPSPPTILISSSVSMDKQVCLINHLHRCSSAGSAAINLQIAKMMLSFLLHNPDNNYCQYAVSKGSPSFGRIPFP